MGLHVFDKTWRKLGQTAAVQRFAVWTQAVLVAVSLATGFNAELGAVFVILAALHLFLPTLNPPRSTCVK
jgi:hypothetical protein